MLPKPWRNNKYKYALVCIDIFTKKADIDPMKDKESNTCNKAMEKVFERLGIRVLKVYIVRRVLSLHYYHS